MPGRDKSLVERVAEASSKPLPYEGLTPAHDGISFSPDSAEDEGDAIEKRASAKLENSSSLFAKATQRYSFQD